MKKLSLWLAGALAIGASACASGDGEAGDPACAVPADKLVSNFESGTNAIKGVDGRQGGWYVYNDMSAGAVQEPMAGNVAPRKGGACDSNYALWTKGTGFNKPPTGWGAGVGTDLASKGGVKNPYDVSKYQGLTFYAKAAAPLALRVKFPDVQTTPMEEGGTCVRDPAMNQCSNDFGVDVELTTEWKKFEVKWSDLKQEPFWGKTFPSFAADKALAIQFQTKSPDFEFWLDYVGFF